MNKHIMTEQEREELRLLQELYDACPDLANELFGVETSSLLPRLAVLREKQFNEEMEPAFTTISAQIMKQINENVDNHITSVCSLPPDYFNGGKV